MATNIKNLIKKGKGKITGHEVGQIMIKDLIDAYLNYLEDNNKRKLLTTAEKNELVNALQKPNDIKRYNEFREIHNFLTDQSSSFYINIKIAESIFWKLSHILQNTQRVEQENQTHKMKPQIVTQEKYDELKEADFKEKMTWTFSVGGIIFDALLYYLQLYEKGKRTPLNKHFTAAKKEKITNPKMIEYYKEIYGDPVPDDETMFNLLDGIADFYCWDEAPQQEILLEFKANYKELYAALWKKLISLKGLSFLKDIPEEDFFNEELIDIKILYDNNILNYKSLVDDFIPEGPPLAVIKGPSFIFDGRIKDGYYNEPIPYWQELYTIKNLLEPDTKESVIKKLAEYKDLLKETHAIKEAILLMGEFIDIPEVDHLVEEIDLKDLNILNDIIRRLPDQANYYDEPDGRSKTEAIRKELKSFLIPIEPEELKPSKEIIEEARRSMVNFETAQGNTQVLIDFLKGEA